MYFNQVVGAEAMVSAEQSILLEAINFHKTPLPSVSSDNIEAIRFYVRAFFYSSTSENVKKWLQGKDFNDLIDGSEIKLYSKENILKNIRRGVDIYRKMRETSKYNLINTDIEEVFDEHVRNEGNNTMLSEYPLRIIEKLFQRSPTHFYIRYNDEENKHFSVRLPRSFVPSFGTMEACASGEADLYRSLKCEGEHVNALFFFYMLGIQNTISS